MAAKKAGAKKAPRKKREFGDRLLSAGKVLSVLTSMGVSGKDFIARYESARGTRSPRGLQAFELEAVEKFQKTGDLEALMGALKTKNQQTALALVGRAVRFKAMQG